MFAGIQEIVEHVASARKVHYINLAITFGGACIALTQALAIRNEVPLELLKVTTKGTTEEKIIEETGKRLACFAESLDIPFSFNIVLVTQMKDINEDMFEIENGEVIAIHSLLFLGQFVGQPDCLEALIRVLKNLNPCVMMVTECEANNTSPIFMEWFWEALCLNGSLFDCLDDGMGRSDPNRFAIEATCFGQNIKNIVAVEDGNRIYRYMKIDYWRNSSKKFGLVETGLGSSSLYQAELVAKQFGSGNFCTCYRNRES